VGHRWREGSRKGATHAWPQSQFTYCCFFSYSSRCDPRRRPSSGRRKKNINNKNLAGNMSHPEVRGEKQDRSFPASSVATAALGGGRGERALTTTGPHICDAQLRDPMTTAISFMVNPGPFRGCCRDTVACWEQAIYLEGELPCLSVLPLPGCSALGGAPVLIGKQKIERLRVFNIPQLGAELDKWMAKIQNLTVVHLVNLSSLQTVGDYCGWWWWTGGPVCLLSASTGPPSPPFYWSWAQKESPAVH
jgi:hypothetical protein